MAKKRSSQRFETEDSQLSQNESGETNDLLNENSDGDDVEKFNEHVKSVTTDTIALIFLIFELFIV